jgi:hypothetical protein
MRFLVKLPIVFAVGFIALITAISLSNFINFFNEGFFFRIIQFNIFINGIISSIILAVSFYLITYKDAKSRKTVEKLEKRIEDLENLLLKHKVPVLPKEKITEIAKKRFKNYKVSKADVNGKFWEVHMEKGKKKITVAIGGYDGEIKDVIYESKLHMIFSNPLKIIGALIIICLLLFSALFFKNFPSMGENLASAFGMSNEQYLELFGEKNLPEGCISASRLALKYKPELPTYENLDVKKLIEDASGIKIKWMYRIEDEGKNYVLALDENFEYVCSSTESVFCECVKVPKG